LPEGFRQEFVAPGRSDTVLSALDTNSPGWRGSTRWYARHEITITNANAQDAAARPVEFDYYLPHRRKTDHSTRPNTSGSTAKIPAILILPIMGGTQYELESYFARSFAKRGFACVILHRPDIKKEVRELEDIDGMLRKSVLDAQRAVDWLEAQPQVDAERLGLFGVSMGAIRGTMVLALDERVRVGVLGLVGGDLPYILTHTREKSLARERTKLLERHQWTLEEVEQRLRAAITCEPLSVAGAVDPARVLMVIAAFDHVIPARKGWELRRKLGNPATIQIFSGHYSAVVYAPYLRWKAGGFFVKKLGVMENSNPKLQNANK
jgi:dienelactone hydrolase